MWRERRATAGENSLQVQAVGGVLPGADHIHDPEGRQEPGIRGVVGMSWRRPCLLGQAHIQTHVLSYTLDGQCSWEGPWAPLEQQGKEKELEASEGLHLLLGTFLKPKERAMWDQSHWCWLLWVVATEHGMSAAVCSVIQEYLDYFMVNTFFFKNRERRF